ncbi:putative ATP-binding cassette transporter [Bradyrhizobium sp. USDA 4532]|uniref:ABC transporter ATP-binding protein/permease n=1 Tax=unclassified Bradyrhizobium TaxID=2631580 RepID=UPI00209E42FB|nr:MULTISPECIES: ABC transporter ATP-binding protein/permease [unclassified Bradyrhizobium]MCP1836094.1 putative ATP-binding cassette transporter [Bradyrhizobium sp. USDA 4545]MCP1920843.1 putative ATP-binding cassette transporter [Bradyrhizobium sp. USDA 4532]
MNNIRSTLATVWRIASPYFNSEDKWAGRGLLAAVIAIELAIVGINVLITQWNNRFYNALQERNWDSFVSEIIYFCVVVAFFILLAVYQLYLNQWLQIRWRQWMTTHYLGDWLHQANHYRMQLQGDAADNPDQRMTDDVKLFVDRTLTLGLGLLSSVVTLASFLTLLWGLSNEAPLHLFGTEYSIPGYLVWCALIYSVLGTVLTHLIGWPLVGIDFKQQQYEADFRFNLVRVRENSEQIALLQGEPAERERLRVRFGRVVENWIALMNRTKKITAFTASYNQASVIFPYVLVAPAYFAQKIQLGGMMQTASAFSNVQGAFSYFVSIYRQLAEWQAVVNRLDGFEAGIAAASNLAKRDDRIHVTATPGDGAVSLENLVLRLPDGTPLLNADRFGFRKGERTLMTGPSGAGKSTLFRAIAGIWPFGDGAVEIPANASLMTLPQRPYLPIGSLHDAVVYPGEARQFDAGRVREVLTAVGLPQLASRLEEQAHWNRMLSLGEQQRLGIARALLHAPQFLFLDEATASLDEPAEAALYRLIAEKLPGTTVVSIGHRSTLDTFHQRNVTLVRDGDRFTLRDAVKVAAS